jgi:probable rRNA maturation factor
MPVDVSTHTGEDGPAAVLEVAERFLELCDCADDELSVMLCDDVTIQGLNLEWRGKDAPTDVLSFPQEEAFPGAPVSLGDVVISLDTAAKQAGELGHSAEIEVQVLLAHGLLHLLGHDHEAPEERAAMEAEERRLLHAVGLDAAGLVGRSG